MQILQEEAPLRPDAFAFSSAVLHASTNTDDATVPTKMALMASLLFIM